MSIDEYKPSPDELLEAIKEEETQKKGGKLKIFFGMCAGVGKTYTMLEEAHQRQKEGVDVQIGVINTHGRKETEELVKGLPIIPQKWIQYRDASFEEMDLDAILQRRPDLVLVDELAHTNVPGTKHPKRWQDVMEILNNGIDVYTTLNVQHLDSRKDVIESITGIPIRETVPDVVLERADTIELIDLSPAELLQRLREGKVYLAEQSRRAVENFFKEETLTALRKIALKFTTEKVDHDLHGFLLQKGKWTVGEKLIVAISSSPYSEQLIRATRKKAFELDAPWIAVYVDRGWALNDEDQKRLSRNISLARDLGAEVITTFDTDIARGIIRIARQKNATRIVIGRPSKKSFQDYFQKNLVEILTEEAKEMDIVVLRQEKLTSLFQKVYKPTFPAISTLKEYFSAFVVFAVITFICWLADIWIDPTAIGFIYLLGILGLSFFLGRGPIIFATILSLISWDFLFIAPTFTFSIMKLENVAINLVFFVTALLIGTMTSRLREQSLFLRQREERMEHLFDIEKEIANCIDFETMRSKVVPQLENLFPGKIEILAVDLNNKLNISNNLPILASDKEQAAANWVFQQGKMAGKFTDTLSSAQAIYFPIQSAKARFGVLVYQPKTDRPLSTSDINFLQTVCQLIQACLERYQLAEKTRIQSFAVQIEKLHSAILHSVSKGFYAPLLKLFDLASTLKKMADENPILIVELEEIAHTLKFIIDNILLLSEIESGFVKLEKIQQNVQPLVEGTIADSAPFIHNRSIITSFPEYKVFFHYDMRLMRLALRNVIINAVENSPLESPIRIEIKLLKNEVCISVLDEGPGIPDDLLPQIFEKFYRIPGSASRGLGLGLAVVKSVIEIHNGKIEVKKTLSQNTEFSIIIPL